MEATTVDLNENPMIQEAKKILKQVFGYDELKPNDTWNMPEDQVNDFSPDTTFQENTGSGEQ